MQLKEESSSIYYVVKQLLYSVECPKPLKCNEPRQISRPNFWPWRRQVLYHLILYDSNRQHHICLKDER